MTDPTTPEPTPEQRADELTSSLTGLRMKVSADATAKQFVTTGPDGVHALRLAIASAIRAAAEVERASKWECIAKALALFRSQIAREMREEADVLYADGLRKPNPAECGRLTFAAQVLVELADRVEKGEG